MGGEAIGAESSRARAGHCGRTSTARKSGGPPREQELVRRQAAVGRTLLAGENLGPAARGQPSLCWDGQVAALPLTDNSLLVRT